MTVSSNLKKVSFGGGAYGWVQTINYIGSFQSSYNHFSSSQKPKIIKAFDSYFWNLRQRKTSSDPTVNFATLFQTGVDGSYIGCNSYGSYANSIPWGWDFLDMDATSSKLYAVGQQDDYTDLEYFFAEFNNSTPSSANSVKYAPSYANNRFDSCGISGNDTKIAMGGIISNGYPGVFIYNTSDNSHYGRYLNSSASGTPIVTTFSGSNIKVKLIRYEPNYSSLEIDCLNTSGSTTYVKRYSNMNSVRDVAIGGGYAYVLFKTNTSGTPIGDTTRAIVKIKLNDGVIQWQKHISYDSGADYLTDKVAVNESNGDVYLVTPYNPYETGSPVQVLRLDTDGNIIHAYQNTTSNWASPYEAFVDGDEGQLLFSDDTRLSSMPADLSKLEGAESGYEWTEITNKYTLYDGSQVSNPTVESSGGSGTWDWTTSSGLTYSDHSSITYPQSFSSSDFESASETPVEF